MTTPLTVSDLDQYLVGRPVPEGYPGDKRVLYSPIDNVHAALHTVIASARHSLVVAMYGYDDDDLAALIDTKLRNPHVYCQLTLDSSQAGGVHEKALLDKYMHDLPANSVAIGRSEKGAIMHRKMVVVDGLWTISGSTNWSTSGESQQDNEATFTRDPFIAADARSVLDREHDHALQAQHKRHPAH